jgi:hypothetical protein
MAEYSEVPRNFTTEELTLASKEKIIVKKYLYQFPDNTVHVLYDVFLITDHTTNVWRATETYDTNDH